MELTWVKRGNKLSGEQINRLTNVSMKNIYRNGINENDWSGGLFPPRQSVREGCPHKSGDIWDTSSITQRKIETFGNLGRIHSRWDKPHNSQRVWDTWKHERSLWLEKTVHLVMWGLEDKEKEAGVFCVPQELVERTLGHSSSDRKYETQFRHNIQGATLKFSHQGKLYFK